MSTSSSSTAKQQSLTSGAQSTTSQSRDKKKAKTKDFDSNSEEVALDLNSNATDYIERTKNYGEKLLHDSKGTVELENTDGSDSLTPRLRQGLPAEIVSLVIHQVFEKGRLCSAPAITLYQCTLVSKLFYSFANPLLWQAPVFSRKVHSSNLFFASLLNNNNNGRYIRELKLNNPSWTDVRLRCLLSWAPHLASLSIYYSTQITDIGFQNLSLYGQHLTSLELNTLPLTRVHFEVIRQYLPQLRILKLVACYGISVEWFTLLRLQQSQQQQQQQQNTSSPPPPPVRGCHLEHLEIICSWTSDESHLIEVIRHFDRLTDLLLANVPPDRPTETPLLPLHVATCWPQLTFLHLENAKKVDDDTWIPFVKAHPLLRGIILSGSVFTDAGLDAMAAHLPFLSQLCLYRMNHLTAEGARLFVLRTTSPRLVMVQLSQCFRIQGYHFPEACPSSPPVTLDSSSLGKIKRRPVLADKINRQDSPQ